MEQLAQSLVYGILVGSVYGIAAVGLSLVFGVMHVLNVAYGELLMLGGYISFFAFAALSIDPFLSLPLAALGLFAGGLLIYLLMFRGIVRTDPEHRINTSMLVAFGLGLILRTAATSWFTADERGITTSYSSVSWQVGPVVIPMTRLLGFVVGVLVALAISHFLNHTRTGRAIRATTENWRAASLMGIDVKKMYALAFPLGAALAGIAGTLVTVGYSVSPNIGLEWTLKALIVVVLAGMGSVMGTVAAGLLLGVAENVGALAIGGTYREAISLLLFIVVLLIRPQGLFGKGARMQ